MARVGAFLASLVMINENGQALDIRQYREFGDVTGAASRPCRTHWLAGEP